MQKILKLYGFKGVIDARESMDGSKYGPGWIKSGLPVMPYNPEQAQASPCGIGHFLAYVRLNRLIYL